MASQIDKLTISKIEAARRQLDCAIELWFLGKDDVSISTLAGAAYQIIHDLNKHKGDNRKLLYDSAMVREEYRNTWIGLFKKPVNFFKHADNDPDGLVEFSPFLNLGFMMFSMIGLNQIGRPSNDYDNALHLWLVVHEPELVSEKYRKEFAKRLGTQDIDGVRGINKADFLKEYLRVLALRRGQGLT